MVEVDPTEKLMVTLPLQTMPCNGIIKTGIKIWHERPTCLWHRRVRAMMGGLYFFIILLNWEGVLLTSPGLVHIISLFYGALVVEEERGEGRSASSSISHMRSLQSGFVSEWQNSWGNHMVIIKHLYNAICILHASWIINKIRALLSKLRISVKTKQRKWKEGQWTTACQVVLLKRSDGIPEEIWKHLWGGQWLWVWQGWKTVPEKSIMVTKRVTEATFIFY